MVWIAVSLLAVGCASGGANWVRADGSPGSAEQLNEDRMACFPDPTEMGEGTGYVARTNADQCMENRGWKRPSGS